MRNASAKQLMGRWIAALMCAVLLLSPVALGRLANDGKRGLYATSIEEVLRLDDDDVDLATAGLAVNSHSWNLTFDSTDADEPSYPIPITAAVVNTPPVQTSIVDNESPATDFTVVSGTWLTKGNDERHAYDDVHYKTKGSGSAVVEWNVTDGDLLLKRHR